ncbi:hypothetical protein [Clostridioides sp. ES-S-0190-01]|uniref:hypothetical protein n=1 Tax=Clostridioides sp. ES-S-0190-01 TaxID=2770787 RepID=UPI001D8641E6|nr:hypothetical protein [Clostridioides sp. ES-S-0190-01]
MDSNKILKLQAEDIKYNNVISGLNSTNTKEAIDELRNLIRQPDSIYSATLDIDLNDWKLKDDFYYKSIKHNLDSKCLLVSIIEKNTQNSLLCSYKIVDNDTIEIFNEIAINATINIVGINTDITPIPSIGENGNWFINGEDTGKSSKGNKGDIGNEGKSAYETWRGISQNKDKTVQEFIESLKGSKGDTGVTPSIGENGNWFIGENDTGKPSRGEIGDLNIDTSFSELETESKKILEAINEINKKAVDSNGDITGDIAVELAILKNNYAILLNKMLDFSIEMDLEQNATIDEAGYWYDTLKDNKNIIAMNDLKLDTIGKCIRGIYGSVTFRNTEIPFISNKLRYIHELNNNSIDNTVSQTYPKDSTQINLGKYKYKIR